MDQGDRANRARNGDLDAPQHFDDMDQGARADSVTRTTRDPLANRTYVPPRFLLFRQLTPTRLSVLINAVLLNDSVTSPDWIQHTLFYPDAFGDQWLPEEQAEVDPLPLRSHQDHPRSS